MRVLSLSAILAALTACASAPDVVEPPEPACHEEMTAAAATEGSIYELDLDLRAQDGQTVELSVHQGHPVLVTMFYASCPQACPMLIQKMQAIEARLDPAVRDDLRVVMVSLDPERDDPAALTQLAARHGLDARWTLASVPDDQVRELSAVLGIRYRQLPNGEFNHSSVITLLDAEGRPLERLDGLEAQDEALIAALTGIGDS